LVHILETTNENDTSPNGAKSTVAIATNTSNVITYNPHDLDSANQRAGLAKLTLAKVCGPSPAGVTKSADPRRG
jgi:hypothetical protein